ncbi:MAG: SpoIIE family protein phosphatase [Streptosporangiaceae bacterium]|nr:SpoIIE family protein phosphatase [Streptosporangiaceae bacterium]
MTAHDSRGSAEDKLQDLQAIVDAAVSLSPDGVLAEVLKRAKAILDADTATVLLLDHSSGHLVATASSGLEEEVLQAARVPVGRGFAGRIATENQPVILEEVNASNVVNPIVLAKGIRSLAGVPLQADGQVIGVLHVGSLTPRRFTSNDIELLKLAADPAVTAVQALAARTDRAAVTVLQQSLLPSRLPSVEGMEMAARYVPGRGAVGGDWYDVFVLPSGQLGVVIGDVAGSGLPAAVIMGRMRSALRAYAMETADPAEVMDRLDRTMQHFEPDAMATVAYAVFDPALDRVRISSAGHLPPVLAVPGKPARLADITGDVLIGFAPDARRHVTTVEVPRGSVLCFYTDGLVERPGEPLDDGLARLCQAMTSAPADAVCSAVMLSLVGPDVPHDDIALLVLRRQRPAPPSQQRVGS